MATDPQAPDTGGLLGFFGRGYDPAAAYGGLLTDPATQDAMRARALAAMAGAFAEGAMPVPYKGGIPFAATLGKAGAAGYAGEDALIKARLTEAQSQLAATQGDVAKRKLLIGEDYIKDLQRQAGLLGTGTDASGAPLTGPAKIIAGGGAKDGETYWTPEGLAALRPTESASYDKIHYPGGDPSTASGAYGFLDRTWRQQAPLAGVDITKYPRAYLAPPELQDKVAAITPISHWTGVDDKGRPFNAAAQKLATNPAFVTGGPASTGAAPAGPGLPPTLLAQVPNFAAQLGGAPPEAAAAVPEGAPGPAPTPVPPVTSVPGGTNSIVPPGVPGPQGGLLGPPPGLAAGGIIPVSTGAVAPPAGPPPMPRPAGPGGIFAAPPVRAPGLLGGVTPAGGPPAASAELPPPPAAPPPPPPANLTGIGGLLKQPPPPVAGLPPPVAAPPPSAGLQLPPLVAGGGPAPPPAPVPGTAPPLAGPQAPLPQYYSPQRIMQAKIQAARAGILGIPVSADDQAALQYEGAVAKAAAEAEIKRRNEVTRVAPGGGVSIGGQPPAFYAPTPITAFNPATQRMEHGVQISQPDGSIVTRFSGVPSAPSEEEKAGGRARGELGATGLPGAPIRPNMVQGGIDPTKAMPSPANVGRPYETNIPAINKQALTPDYETYKRAVPEWIKESGELSDAAVHAQQAEENLSQITKAYSMIQTGTWTTEKAMFAGVLKALNITPPQSLGDLSAVQTALHNNYKQTLQGLAATNKRFTGNEFKINAEAGENPNIQPEANLNLLSTDIAQVRQIQALAADWNHAQTVVAHDGSRWVNPDSFKTAWISENPLSQIVAATRKEIAPLIKGATPELPEGSVPTGRTYGGKPSYLVPDGKGGHTEKVLH